MQKRTMFYFFLILLVGFSVVLLIFQSNHRNRIMNGNMNFHFNNQSKNTETFSTSLITGTDFDGEMTYKVSNGKITEILVSAGLSNREVIVTFFNPEDDLWSCVYTDRYFVFDAKENNINTTLTHSLNITSYFFSGEKLLKSVCISENNPTVKIPDILSERRFYLKSAKLRKKELDIERFAKYGSEDID